MATDTTDTSAGVRAPLDYSIETDWFTTDEPLPALLGPTPDEREIGWDILAPRTFSGTILTALAHITVDPPPAGRSAVR